MPDVRVTVAVAQILRVLLDDPDQPRYGYGLMQATGLPSGRVYPILTRLLTAGWVTKTLEDVDPAEAELPARYIYRLSEKGTAAARTELARLHQQLAPATPLRGDAHPKGLLA